MDAARQQLEQAFSDYAPEIATAGRTLLERLHKRVPGAAMLVYDNYNALAIGFAAEDRASSVVLSIALYPRWITCSSCAASSSMIRIICSRGRAAGYDMSPGSSPIASMTSASKA